VSRSSASRLPDEHPAGRLGFPRAPPPRRLALLDEARRRATGRWVVGD
jgi:hypothetical protein